EDVTELYLSGGLPAFGEEVIRLPEEGVAGAGDRPRSVIAEMGVSAGWRAPLPRLAAAESPSLIVTSPSTPPLLREASSALAGRLAPASALEGDSGQAPPH